MTNGFITPKMCETLYVHYDMLLRATYQPTWVRRMLQDTQAWYAQRHAELVPFDEVAGELIEILN